MKTVAIINHKGGVGKTTLTGCLGQALALCGFRALLIDNDSQHNLSSMLGVGIQSPGIRDVYRGGEDNAAGLLLKAVHTSVVDGLHVVTADRELSTTDVPDPFFLRRVFERAGLARHYDYVLIDNAPGMEARQVCAMHAADELFVPTELRQFAVDGIVEMEQALRERYPHAPPIARIIPNFYRNVKRQNSFLAALHALFPGRVSGHVIPQDMVFDELVTDSKILFVHRLSSRGAAYYLKLMHELFNLNEDEVWQTMLTKRREHRAEEARARLLRRSA